MVIDRIKKRHHGLARDLAGGYRLEVCAKKWGFRLDVAKYLSTHHLFKELMSTHNKADVSPSSKSSSHKP